MDADTAKAAHDGVKLWGEIGAFFAGILGLRGAQWIGARRGNDVIDEIRNLRESLDAHNAKLNELLSAMVADLAVLKDRKDR